MEQTERLTNIIENTACQVAQLRSGRIVPHHLMPYLPVSLDMICTCLNAMVDGAAVTAGSRDGIQEYVFAEYTEKPTGGTELSVPNCVGCSVDLGSVGRVLCPTCWSEMEKDLSVLAEKNGWPAQAVYEHEIIYLAAKENGPLAAETLAGASNFTLRSMKKKLATMAESRFLKTEPGNRDGIVHYVFPELRYPKNRFQENQGIIRSYPASVMEEVELRIVRVLTVLGCIFLFMLVLAFWGFPFVMLMPAFMVVAPITAILIWKHKSKIKEI